MTASICNECAKHDRECHAQGYIVDRARIDKSDSLLKIKVNRIESIVERLAKMQHEQSVVAPRDSQGCSFERMQNNIFDGSELDEHAQTSSPLFSLFNNEVVGRQYCVAAYLIYRRSSRKEAVLLLIRRLCQ